jgi:predicted DNA binding CopG/RHH family protein
MALDDEEKKTLDAYERGEWTPNADLPGVREAMSRYARATLRKDKRVNIRISRRDLSELQRHAVHEGLPYQTLMSSILHKYVNGGYAARAKR